MNATLSLTRGQLFGRPLATADVDGVLLTESWYEPQSGLPPHRHEHANLCLVLAGSFDEAFGTTSRSCRSAILLYRPPGESHTQRFHAHGARCVTIEPPLDWNGRVEGSGDGSVDLGGLPATLALRLYSELRRSGGPSSLEVAALSRQLFGVTARRVWLGEQRMPKWFFHARALLLADCARPLRVAALATAVGVHPVHLARTFRRAFGHGVADHVWYIRTQAACRAILGGEESLSRIAANLGFSDHSHFTRVFKSRMGLTPSTFRHRMVALRSPRR